MSNVTPAKFSNQNMRGGKVKLHSILMPPSEFEHAEKGDALHGNCFPKPKSDTMYLLVILLVCLLYIIEVNFFGFVDSAMELALSLEKLTNEKLLSLHRVIHLDSYVFIIHITKGILSLQLKFIVFLWL